MNLLCVFNQFRPAWEWPLVTRLALWLPGGPDPAYRPLWKGGERVAEIPRPDLVLLAFVAKPVLN